MCKNSGNPQFCSGCNKAGSFVGFSVVPDSFHFEFETSRDNQGKNETTTLAISTKDDNQVVSHVGQVKYEYDKKNSSPDDPYFAQVALAKAWVESGQAGSDLAARVKWCEGTTTQVTGKLTQAGPYQINYCRAISDIAIAQLIQNFQPEHQEQ